jgi:ATP-binding cassette subfamily C (CFTR/MRP) protein 1
LQLLLSCASVFSVLNAAIDLRRRNALEPITLVFLTFLTYYNHQRTRRAATLTLLFWPLYVLQMLPWLHATLSADVPSPPGCLYWTCIVLFLGVSSLVLEGLGTEDPEPGENPVVTANVYSRWSFGYTTALLKTGASQYITEEDLPRIVEEDTSRRLGEDLVNAYAKQYVFLVALLYIPRKRAFVHSKSLWRALAAAYGGPYMTAIILRTVQDCLAFMQPQLLRLLLTYIYAYQDARRLDTATKPSIAQGFGIAAAMFVSAAIQSVTLNQARLSRSPPPHAIEF